MTEELQEQIPQSEETQQPAPAIAPPGAPKSNWLPWIMAGVAGVLICLCCMACLALVAMGVGKVMLEKGPVETVLHSFMDDMRAKDVDSAYALFSPRSKRTTPITALEKMLKGSNYVLFDGYDSLSVQTINISAAVNTNSNMPQGTVANVTGTVQYQDGFTGRFTAVLEKVDGEWKLFNINITVPPDKFDL